MVRHRGLKIVEDLNSTCQKKPSPVTRAHPEAGIRFPFRIGQRDDGERHDTDSGEKLFSEVFFLMNVSVKV